MADIQIPEQIKQSYGERNISVQSAYDPSYCPCTAVIDFDDGATQDLEARSHGGGQTLSYAFRY